jgi:VWFA-related protein
MTTIRIWLAALLALSMALLIRAQDATFRARSNVVTVPTLVKDDHGQVMYGLKADDFIIEDEGTAQSAQLDQSAEPAPASVVVALQCGRRASREFSRMQGLASMLSSLFGTSGSQVALVEFDSEVRLLQDFAENGEAIENALSNLRAGDSGAAILDAIQYSVRLLDQLPRERRRVLLLISETRDHGSRFAKMTDVASQIGNSSTVVYALPFSPSLSQVLDTERGSNKDERRSTGDLLAPLLTTSQAMRRNTPKAITEMTGGEYEMFTSRKSFERLMTAFANHLQSRYLLSFQPKDPHPGLHQLRVRLRQRGKGTVLARTSYWAEGESAQQR